jgi:hypothetical protein
MGLCHSHSLNTPSAQSSAIKAKPAAEGTNHGRPITSAAPAAGKSLINPSNNPQSHAQNKRAEVEESTSTSNYYSSVPVAQGTVLEMDEIAVVLGSGSARKSQMNSIIESNLVVTPEIQLQLAALLAENDHLKQELQQAKNELNNHMKELSAAKTQRVQNATGVITQAMKLLSSTETAEKQIKYKTWNPHKNALSPNSSNNNSNNNNNNNTNINSASPVSSGAQPRQTQSLSSTLDASSAFPLQQFHKKSVVINSKSQRSPDGSPQLGGVAEKEENHSENDTENSEINSPPVEKDEPTANNTENNNNLSSSHPNANININNDNNNNNNNTVPAITRNSSNSIEDAVLGAEHDRHSPSSSVSAEEGESLDYSEFDEAFASHKQMRRELMELLIQFAEQELGPGSSAGETTSGRSSSLSYSTTDSALIRDALSQSGANSTQFGSAVVTLSDDNPVEASADLEEESDSFGAAIRKSNLDDATKRWLSEEFMRGASGHGGNEGNNRKNSITVLSGQRKNSTLGQSVNTSPKSQGLSPSNSAILEINGAAQYKMILSDALLLNSLNFSALESWEFDALQYSTEQQICFAYRMLHNLDLIKRFDISESTVNNFLVAVSSDYVQGNSYHNFSHGVDVMHCVYMYIQRTDILNAARIRSLDLLALMISAATHDLGHTGTNNTFHINTQSELALRYNDQSVLEHFHCASTFKLLNDKRLNIFQSLSKRDFLEVRKVIISVILSTDLSHHFDMVAKLDGLFERLEQKIREMDRQAGIEENKEKNLEKPNNLQASPSKRQSHIGSLISFNPQSSTLRRKAHLGPSLLSREDQLQLLNVFMHSADVSNATKPWNIAKQWADRILEEFFVQGELEQAAGLPISPFMDRNNENQPQMSINFIDFIVGPLLASLVNAFPPLVSCAHNLIKNRKQWDSLLGAKLEQQISSAKSGAEKLAKENEKRTLQQRASKFQNTFILPSKNGSSSSASIINSVSNPSIYSRATSSTGAAVSYHSRNINSYASISVPPSPYRAAEGIIKIAAPMPTSPRGSGGKESVMLNNILSGSGANKPRSPRNNPSTVENYPRRAANPRLPTSGHIINSTPANSFHHSISMNPNSPSLHANSLPLVPASVPAPLQENNEALPRKSSSSARRAADPGSSLSAPAENLASPEVVAAAANWLLRAAAGKLKQKKHHQSIIQPQASPTKSRHNNSSGQQLRNSTAQLNRRYSMGIARIRGLLELEQPTAVSASAQKLSAQGHNLISADDQQLPRASSLPANNQAYDAPSQGSVALSANSSPRDQHQRGSDFAPASGEELDARKPNSDIITIVESHADEENINFRRENEHAEQLEEGIRPRNDSGENNDGGNHGKEAAQVSDAKHNLSIAV